VSRVVLLTGATGFVGRQVLRALMDRGLRTRLIVRDTKQHQVEDHELIEGVVITPDLFAEGAEWWDHACQGIDTVIHVAWYTEPGQYLHSAKNLDCLIGTLQLAKGATLAGVRRFVGIGTCFEYDLSDGRLAIETPLRPLTPYAGAKAGAFMALSRWFPQKGVLFSWCRLFYLFGEHEDERRLVPYIRRCLSLGERAELTSGTQVRDYLDVRKAGQMIADIALGEHEGAANICSGVPITVRQFAEQIADEYGRRDLLRFGERPDNPIDPPCVIGVRECLQ
jgi:dTDP-6-deoxy-L-talose 4-dehydrogenase (NAD+)